MLCYVTPKEHLGLPEEGRRQAGLHRLQDRRARGRRGARHPRRARPRRRADQGARRAQLGEALRARASTPTPRARYHDEDLDVDTDFCAMCGHDWCSVRISKEIVSSRAAKPKVSSAKGCEEPRPHRRPACNSRATGSTFAEDITSQRARHARRSVLHTARRRPVALRRCRQSNRARGAARSGSCSYARSRGRQTQNDFEATLFSFVRRVRDARRGRLLRRSQTEPELHDRRWWDDHDGDELRSSRWAIRARATRDKAVAAGMAAKCAASRCDFGILLGDNIYESGASSPDDPQLKEKFEDVYAALKFRVPIVLGNHDYGAAGLGTDFAKAQNGSRTRKSRRSGGCPRRTMRSRNSQRLLRARHEPDDVRERRPAEGGCPWFDRGEPSEVEDRARSSSYKSNGPHGNAGSYDALGSAGAGRGQRRDRTPSTGSYCGKVDLYLSAHDHSMQWMGETCKGTQLGVSGSARLPRR